MIKELTTKYAVSRFIKVLIQSDLLTTRAMIGFSSFIFGVILSTHYISMGHFHDLFWTLLSFFHSFVVLFSLYFERINKITFFGEAVLGFILWNFISFSVILTTYTNTITAFPPIEAAMPPSFVIGLATWWVLSRYPKIKRKG